MSYYSMFTGERTIAWYLGVYCAQMSDIHPRLGDDERRPGPGSLSAHLVWAHWESTRVISTSHHPAIKSKYKWNTVNKGFIRTFKNCWLKLHILHLSSRLVSICQLCSDVDMTHVLFQCAQSSELGPARAVRLSPLCGRCWGYFWSSSTILDSAEQIFDLK